MFLFIYKICFLFVHEQYFYYFESSGICYGQDSPKKCPMSMLQDISKYILY